MVRAHITLFSCKNKDKMASKLETSSFSELYCLSLSPFLSQQQVSSTHSNSKSWSVQRTDVRELVILTFLIRVTCTRHQKLNCKSSFPFSTFHLQGQIFFLVRVISAGEGNSLLFEMYSIHMLDKTKGKVIGSETAPKQKRRHRFYKVSNITIRGISPLFVH